MWFGRHASHRWAALAVALGSALLLAGCGAATSPTASAATSSSAVTAPVAVGHATVKGKSTKVLTTTSGMTLYYFTSDTATTSKCTGSCTSLWPPLLTTHKTLKDPPGLTKPFKVVKDANGDQVSYDGHLLYTYSGDTAPGQALGEGLLGKWWVATPNLGSSSSSSSSSSGGYGGY